MLKKGTRVRVKPHTTYQHLSKGAVVEPPIPRRHNGYRNVTVEAYLEDDASDDPRVVIRTDYGNEDIVPESTLEVLEEPDED